jgi:16S rRNA (cytidine1402-2'-O)-methyltransferase
LTKLHEEVFRGTVEEALEHLSEPRGEITLIIAGSPGGAAEPETGEVSARLEKMKQSGASAREAVALVASETGISRRELYRQWLELR